MHRRFAAVVAAGGLLVILLVGLVASVVWVSDSAKHPLNQPVSFPSTASTPTVSPTSSVVATPSSSPSPLTEVRPPFDASQAAQLTAEMITPPPPVPRHSLLQELFPHLFPSG